MPMCVSVSLAIELPTGQQCSSQTSWLKVVLTLEISPQTTAHIHLAGAIAQLATPQLSHICLYTTAYWLMRQLLGFTGRTTKWALCLSSFPLNFIYEVGEIMSVPYFSISGCTEGHYWPEYVHHVALSIHRFGWRYWSHRKSKYLLIWLVCVVVLTLIYLLTITETKKYIVTTFIDLAPVAPGW